MIRIIPEGVMQQRRFRPPGIRQARSEDSPGVAAGGPRTLPLFDPEISTPAGSRKGSHHG